ncbi:Intradiol ring-cleavage dioxygenase core [Penicillium paradoxum]|uniref:Intradiol ring-cleavage dioxygenase core n=1 Tax=Penicillium paradoxum TaxID=176176 RepID=UPI00254852AD|nr:Intradiol ring-cleavage dioxygenase core [Penicillium paradoxum]KAJ5781312.1 Intradiol ring-cleavage dioxygenase core [Penicillium paradoxum]
MVQLFKRLTITAAFLAAPAIASPGEKHDPHVLKSFSRWLQKHLHARELKNATSLVALTLSKRFIGLAASRTAPQKWRPDLAALERGGDFVGQNFKEELYSDGPDGLFEVLYIHINTCKPVSDCYIGDLAGQCHRRVQSITSNTEEYLSLGDGLDDGFFASIQIGINAPAAYTGATYHDADDGQQDSDSLFGSGAGLSPAPSGSGIPSSGTRAFGPSPTASARKD